jgi:shikimate kinase
LIGAVFIIGMPGAGKSTVGRELARRLQLRFIDADAALERRCGTTVATVFSLEGEHGFRVREAALIDEVTRQNGLVLATGGGAVLLESNRRCLRSRGIVLYLRVEIDELLRRTRHERSRPLLQVGDQRARLQQLFEQREPLYRETAHVTIDSGAGSPRKLAERVLADPTVRAALGLDSVSPLQ